MKFKTMTEATDALWAAWLDNYQPTLWAAWLDNDQSTTEDAIQAVREKAAEVDAQVANLQGRLDAADDYIAEHKRKIERIKKLMGEKP